MFRPGMDSPLQRRQTAPMENVLAMIPAIVALMLSPGPVTLTSAAFGAAYGRRAVRLVLVMTAGTATIIVMVALGVFGLVTALPGVEPVLIGLGGVYILYLAWKIWSAPPMRERDVSAEMPAAIGVYLMALANPKAFAAMAALFSGFPLIEADPLANGVVKSIMLICCATTINLSWMSIGTVLARLMSDPGTSRTLNRAFAVMLVLSVVAMLVL